MSSACLRLRIIKSLLIIVWLFAAVSGAPAQRQGTLRDIIRERRDKERNTETQQIAGLKVALWRPKSTSPAPLIVFSHGFRGCNIQSVFLMEALSEAGYFVVAPNHEDAACGETGLNTRAEEPFRNPSAWSDESYKDRGKDVTELLDALRKHTELSARIDWNRIGLAGHSLGGYTVLGLAGAWRSWKTPAVKAVLALSPYCQPFLSGTNLETLGIPIMFQGGTRDVGITPSVKKNSGCFEKTSSPAYFVEFQDAGHFVWTDLQKPFQNVISHNSVAFFDKHLRGRATAQLDSKAKEVSDLRVK